MRRYLVVRSISAAAWAALAVFAAPAAVAAVVPLFPTEGATVRETVRIAVAKSDVPEGGYVVFTIDGDFVAAVGVPREISGGRTAFVHDWDTKAPLTAQTIGFGLGAAPRYVEDGRHEIGIVIYDASGKVQDRGAVSVRVSNKIPTTIPPKPVKLAYRFATGQQMRFEIHGKVELLDIEGRPMLDNPVVLDSTSQVTVSVEDLMPGSALMRYRWQPMVSILHFGQPYPQPIFVPAATYKYVSSGGKVTEAGFGAKSKSPTFGLFVTVPGGNATPGQSWTGSDYLTVPGIVQSAKLDMRQTFDSMEWESGHETAKIKMDISTKFGLTLIPDRLVLPDTDMTGSGTAYFAYKSNKLISTEYVVEAKTDIDSSTLESLRSGQAGDIGSLVLPGTGAPMPEEGPESAPSTEPGARSGAAGATRSGGYVSPLRPGGYAGGGYGDETSTAGTTPVKLRVTVSVSLKK